jgi:Zinc finger, C3HC4 type (RING finger)
MQRTYLVSINLGNFVDWPIESDTIIFKGYKKLTIGNKEYRFFGPPQVENLCMVFSYAPFSLVLSCPLLGKVDIYIKTSVLRSSVKVDKEIPNEYELTELFRCQYPRLLYSNPSDDSGALPEKIPLYIGTLISTNRFKVNDEYFWDETIRGFVKGTIPFDVHAFPVSCVFTTIKQSWYSFFMTTSFYETVNKMPLLSLPPLFTRVPTVLIIDYRAPTINYKVLTMEILKSQQYLRINPETYRKWHQERILESLDGSATSIIQIRKLLSNVEFAPRLAIHPSLIHWRAVVFEDRLVFNACVPSADWFFLINSSTKSWVTGYHEDVVSLKNCIQKLTKKEVYPEHWDLIKRTSWRLPLQKKRLMIRLLFYDISNVERLMMKESKDPLFTSFGLVQLQNETWSSKAGLFRLYKKDGILSSEYLDQCLEGFALENAKVLLNGTQPKCIICCTNNCNTFLDSCGHTFCDTCVKSHVSVGGTNCPVCRCVLRDGEWSQIRRSTPRKQETFQFSKKQQIVTLVTNLKGNIAVIVPNQDCKDQVLSWIDTSEERLYVFDIDSFVHDSYKFDHVICSTSLVPDIHMLEILHQILQNNSTDCTSMHVLVGKNGNGEEEDYKWVREFSKAYSNMIEMSSYIETEL